MSHEHRFEVRWSEEDGEYVGTCAELPGLSWLDAKRSKALSGIQRLVSECETDMASESISRMLNSQ